MRSQDRVGNDASEGGRERKVVPMPAIPAETPNRSVTQPNMLIPLMAAVIAPVL